MPPSRQSLKYRTQWATQFYAAAELTRRDYLVSLTLGNAAVADLHVKSPQGRLFTVDVKGQSNKSFWLLQRREPDPMHFYVLVYLPRDEEPPSFYVVPSRELMRLRQEYEAKAKERGRYRESLGGMNWGTALQYADRWDLLPR